MRLATQEINNKYIDWWQSVFVESTTLELASCTTFSLLLDRTKLERFVVGWSKLLAASSAEPSIQHGLTAHHTHPLSFCLQQGLVPGGRGNAYVFVWPSFSLKLSLTRDSKGKTFRTFIYLFIYFVMDPFDRSVQVCVIECNCIDLADWEERPPHDPLGVGYKYKEHS